MRLWWCSFVDPDKPEGEQFLGAAVVPCDPEIEVPASVALAVMTEAGRLGCNPGGSVKFVELPPDMARMVPEASIGRLLPKDEALRLSHDIRPEAVRQLAG